MKRKAYQKLVDWKNNYAARYALMIDGARRVGKSYLAEEFAKAEYEAYVLIDFSKVKKSVKSLFDDYLDDLDTFFMMLQTELRVSLPRGKSLVIFDEVQCFPRAREAIKHLVLDGRYHYLETGSLISIKKNVADILIPSEEMHLDLNPMDLEEFLWATGNPVMMDTIRAVLQSGKPYGQALFRQMMLLFRQYLVVGGMPQAVQEFVSSHDLKRVDVAKREVLNLYRQDIRKFGGRLALKIESIWDEIPAQLSRHEKRFKPGSLGASVRMRNLVEAFQWLKAARTVNVVYNVTDPNVGLKMAMESAALKCYMGDTGLLISHAFDENELSAEDVHRRILTDKISLNEGMLMENVVAQMIVASGRKPYFYSRIDPNHADKRMEIDFLLSKTKIGRHKNIVPIEVKSAKRYTQVSLDKFRRKFAEFIDRPTVLGVCDYSLTDGVASLPLYAAPALLEEL